MKSKLFMICLALIMGACNETKKDREATDEMIEPDVEYTTGNSRSNPEGEEREQNKTSPDETGNTNENDDETSTSAGIASGLYIKKDTSDGDCSCYCVEVSTSGNTELCLAEEEIFINARFSEGEGNTINAYYVNPSAKNTNEELPWDEFDTSIPVAVLTPMGNGFKLDWKGFSIDGEIAVDYAIYGKKTLEGEYKKK